MKPAPSAPFPWDDAMTFGFGVLRLSPSAFWSLTQRELAAAIEGRFGKPAQATARETLRALMTAFPDEATR